jgi:hypothetical protein
MKTYSAYNDDGVTITVKASSEEEATEKTAAESAVDVTPLPCCR